MNSPTNPSSIRHQAWGLMCSRQTFSCKEIAQTLNIKTNKVVGFTRSLIRKRAIEVIDKRNKYQGTLYRVCIERQALQLQMPMAPKRKERRIKKGTRSQQIWNTIRIHRSFSVELLQTTTNASLSLINNYVWHLEQSGFIRKQGRFLNQSGYSCVKYMLIKDLGRLYPTTQKQGMWDQNTQTFYPFKERGNE
ncbi:hypothetical protein [Shewanella psychrotolerans]|uniref:hypothetical protein n=1 Tax=Shewanella psychrotolerans TaxID=2864206 RepID=UPI001C65FA97|nr:hypothetical protein [Shewanella psychrotolerans]QYK02770.1 hypothetical protein K0I62_07475 [Shewanella psychrotolerans]